MSKERFEWHSHYKRMVLDAKTNKIIKVIDTLNQQAQRVAELEEQLKKSFESNNELLKQIMELQTQLIKERLKGENK